MKSISNYFKYKRFVFCFLFLICLTTVQSQILDSVALAQMPLYTSLTEALKKPDSVYKLTLRKKKLKEIPKEVFTFTNLQELNLSKNKISKIPKEISKLTHLQKLDLSMNSIDSIPEEIGFLTQIVDLIINQNHIVYLPPQIGFLTKMRFLDLWSNEIQYFPEDISKLANTLKTVDLRVIILTSKQQEKIEQLLPYTKIYFSFTCNCNSSK